MSYVPQSIQTSYKAKKRAPMSQRHNHSGSWIRMLFCIFVFHFSVGCAGYNPFWTWPSYGWGFYNATDTEINDVRMTYRREGVGRLVGTGVLPSHGRSTQVYGDDVMPAGAKIHWRDKDCVVHDQMIEIAPNVPGGSHFDGFVYFKYNGNNWELVP